MYQVNKSATAHARLRKLQIEIHCDGQIMKQSHLKELFFSVDTYRQLVRRPLAQPSVQVAQLTPDSGLNTKLAVRWASFQI